MKLIFLDSPHFLQSIANHDSPGLLLKLFDQPLIEWNIKLIEKVKKIDTILIPEKYKETFLLVKEKFPSIQVNNISNEDLENSQTPQTELNLELENLDIVRLNLNSVLYQSKDTQEFIIETIKYPWDFLRVIQEVLNNHVLETKISPSATIPKSTVLEGPCVIEEDAVIDDFCKIKGPIFIGKNSFIGMGSLVRNCMIGRKTTIGFNCEIAKCYYSGQTEIAHHNVILDSVIGENVWFGGYTGTANVLLTKKNVKFQIDEDLVDTGTDHFGAMVGHNSAVGAAVIILPGRHLPANSSIQAGTIFGKK